ncbi:MAG TPA: hypothetical protein VEY13_07325 [Rubrobacteraceae bacterium]|nr:hypothetical protein [Rubrobacteraceae bacterium]
MVLSELGEPHLLLQLALTVLLQGTYGALSQADLETLAALGRYERAPAAGLREAATDLNGSCFEVYLPLQAQQLALQTIQASRSERVVGDC